jgi:diguanylate cyclase (GGDEF)-like protein
MLIQFQLNIATLILLVVVFITIRTRTQIEGFGTKIIEMSIITTVIALIVEPLTWVFDAKQFFGAYFLEYSTNFLLVLMSPIIGGFMLSYVDYSVFKDRQRIFRRHCYMYFSIMTFVLLIVNIFFPIYFKIDPVTNVYQQGNLFWIHYGVIVLMYIYMVWFVLKNRHKVYSYVIRIFLIFFLLPVIGMVVQIFDSRLHFAWSAVALAILINYTFLETNSGERDYLTKLYNRKSYEKYVNHLIEIKQSFKVVLIDLNNFKEVNDQFGHHVGDQVLISFATILEKNFPAMSKSFRMAGDEFMIVTDSDIDIAQINANIHIDIEKNVLKEMQGIDYAYGHHSYIEGMSIDELYNIVDKRMYENKNNGKQ